ncbi:MULTISPECIES: helix-turn-helix transcriptional regulator [Lactobacillales]|uniref:helix-turn-helix transcriptional regulator n=1 Tax=Lactobacillales TaxID=186826 RepID=UPI0035DEE516
MATIINKVREKRKEQHLTQEDLANKVGVTRKTILSLEKGSYIPSLLLAMDLASALNIKIDQLFFRGE